MKYFVICLFALLFVCACTEEVSKDCQNATTAYTAAVALKAFVCTELSTTREFNVDKCKLAEAGVLAAEILRNHACGTAVAK